MRAAVAGDRLLQLPRIGSDPMPEADITKAMKLLDLVLEFFLIARETVGSMSETVRRRGF